ncbi:MAG: adenylate/guanylate cyclase domain-containing protein [Proteobacteria bacterium]|nr:adenylate/guanylate cyclase domain-containing protein [Pseudomonadota bacterium]
MDRKLAVILYADVAGYSRLTGADEERTHRILSAYLDLLTKLIGDHGGTVLHYAGDAVLAEFPSIVIAVTCAVEIQRSLAQRNREFPRDQRLEFRIGINLGDVIVDRDEIYGDGVNLAARLESLAEPGGICVSVAVHDQVADKLDVNFEDIGVHEVKNIARPVQAYRVTFDTPTRVPEESQPSRNKSSIAVLPFVNMSADPEQEFFADGIAEDLLTKLTNILGLFVIARNSSFRYKGKAVDVRQIAEELGVRYVLEGSVRKAGNRVRVTAQLIEAASGSHLWAEAYDRDLTDVFAVQDDITVNVVKALQVTLLEGEQARVWHRSTDNLEAWSCLTRATAHFDHATVEENRAGIELLERAVELDPDYASAWAWLGWLLSHEVRFLWADDPDAVMARAAQCADKALALDDGLAEAHMLLAFVHVLRRDFDNAIAHAERGVALGPSNANVVALLAFNLNRVGRPEEALAWVEKAMRLSPMSPSWFIVVRAHALRLLGRFEEAMKAYKAAIAATPGYISPYIGLTVCYAEMGREHDAQEQARKVLKLDPRFSIARHLSTPGYKDKSLNERSARALRQAGLPE